ncbi:DUF3231 family protein [Gracilibacillus salitolerans]|uniref:DUF3231 family protein n=1 Tax=Gracilibacillus salitolerans TaxID=2663022 RepID=A0A5Q2TIR2_9BACI|nr:DUF3231 family protein [Gracilibacillus salitolerans]QGH33298.1 DUF3231 family protein [Gracilibacillus salitolerans]
MEHNHDNIKLTSAEVSYLWNTYLGDSLSICVFKYFLEHVEDKEIKTITTHALDLSQQHIETIQSIFLNEGIQIPQGFTEQDVNLKSKRLFTDVFYLKYIKNMTKGGLATYGRLLQNIYRHDIRSFFSKCLTSTIELDTEVVRLLLEKGIAACPPTIPYPQKIEFVHKQSFFLEGLGRRDALTGAEVANLHSNIETNQLGTSLAIAFSQVAQSNKVRKFILRGNDIASKHIKVFSSYLEMNSLPVPMSFDQEVTESTESPFSDKLMLFHFGLMIYAGIGNYGVAISESRKSDLVVDYTRLTAEILKLSEDFANIIVANEWLEQPPLSANRKDLTKG